MARDMFSHFVKRALIFFAGLLIVFSCYHYLLSNNEDLRGDVNMLQRKPSSGKRLPSKYGNKQPQADTKFHPKMVKAPYGQSNKVYGIKASQYNNELRVNSPNLNNGIQTQIKAPVGEKNAIPINKENNFNTRNKIEAPVGEKNAIPINKENNFNTENKIEAPVGEKNVIVSNMENNYDTRNKIKAPVGEKNEIALNKENNHNPRNINRDSIARPDNQLGVVPNKTQKMDKRKYLTDNNNDPSNNPIVQNPITANFRMDEQIKPKTDLTGNKNVPGRANEGYDIRKVPGNVPTVQNSIPTNFRMDKQITKRRINFTADNNDPHNTNKAYDTKKADNNAPIGQNVIPATFRMDKQNRKDFTGYNDVQNKANQMFNIEKTKSNAPIGQKSANVGNYFNINNANTLAAPLVDNKVLPKAKAIVTENQNTFRDNLLVNNVNVIGPEGKKKDTENVFNQKKMASIIAKRPLVDNNGPMIGKVINNDRTIRNNDESPFKGRVMENKANDKFVYDHSKLQNDNIMRKPVSVQGNEVVRENINAKVEKRMLNPPQVRNPINQNTQAPPNMLYSDSMSNIAVNNGDIRNDGKFTATPWKKHRDDYGNQYRDNYLSSISSNQNLPSKNLIPMKQENSYPQQNQMYVNKVANKNEIMQNIGDKGPSFSMQNPGKVVKTSGQNLPKLDLSKRNIPEYVQPHLVTKDVQMSVKSLILKTSENHKSFKRKTETNSANQQTNIQAKPETVIKETKNNPITKAQTNCNIYNLKAKYIDALRCEPVQAYKPPVTFCLYPEKEDGKISKMLRNNIMWDSETHRDILIYLAKEPSIGFIDIGANIGGHCLHIAKLGYKVLAVEPAYENIHRIHKAAVLNGVIDKIVLLQNVLSAEKLMHHYANISNIVMDDLLQVIDFNAAVMRIDTEGLESRAFIQSSSLLSKIHIPAIFIAWKHVKPWFGDNSTRGRSQVTSMLKDLKTRGYVPLEIGIDDIARGMLDVTKWGEWPDEVKFVLRSHF